MPETARSKPLEIWFQDEARVGQQGTLTRIWAERGTRPRAPRDTRYIWSYIFGAVCPERAEAAALIMPHADTQAMSAHLAEIAKTVASGAHALLILDGAGWHGSAELEVPTTSPCSNSRPIPLNSTRWKMCGLICVPTSSPYPSSTIMSRSSTGVAKHGTVPIRLSPTPTICMAWRRVAREGDKAGMDVSQREDLSFPRSLPEFQRLFPDGTACAA